MQITARKVIHVPKPTPKKYPKNINPRCKNYWEEVVKKYSKQINLLMKQGLSSSKVKTKNEKAKDAWAFSLTVYKEKCLKKGKVPFTIDPGSKIANFDVMKTFFDKLEKENKLADKEIKKELKLLQDKNLIVRKTKEKFKSFDYITGSYLVTTFRKLTINPKMENVLSEIFRLLKFNHGYMDHKDSYTKKIPVLTLIRYKYNKTDKKLYVYTEHTVHSPVAVMLANLPLGKRHTKEEILNKGTKEIKRIFKKQGITAFLED